MASQVGTGGTRVEWVDYAKGWCIILVVMMHATLGVGEAMGHEGWLHTFVAFARPFRMPDFFLISGLFLAHSIHRDWRTYLDRKVLHFAYFYFLWVAVQCSFKCWALAGLGPMAVLNNLALALVEPYGTLWFIYLLPVFFITTKLLLRVPVPVVLGLAAALQMSQIHTGWTVIDEFAARYVYFYAGYVFAPHFFALADWARAHSAWALGGLLLWAVGNGVLVFTGLAPLPGIALALGFVGAAAVVTFAALLAKGGWLKALRHAGANSIVVYLAFFLPMALTRSVLIKLGVISDVGTVSLIVTAVAVVAPLVLHALVRGTALRFLFERPAIFWLSGAPKNRLMAAE
jgi:uncharacterized membrane protein YcfT